jgi:N-acetylmuramate 1-kinase
MTATRPDLATALARAYPGSRVASLPSDASTRRYHRLFLGDGSTRIVMDYGAPFEGETDDIRLARIFEAAGLPVARVLESHPEAGCLVLDDLGDRTLEAALGESAADLHAKAVRLATEIATRGTAALAASERAAGPALDRERFRFEMGFFLENYLGRYLGRPEVDLRLRLRLEALADAAAAHPRVLCHRDYHSRNLMVRDDGSLSMVDIQDARWGPDTYDIASLLRDAYVDLDEASVEDLLELYRSALPEMPGRTPFRERFRIVATQRMIKALGTFGYQIAVLGRERYESAIPRTLVRLMDSLPRHPYTAPLSELLEAEGVFRRP